MIRDEQARHLSEELARDGRLGLAAMRTGMDRKTARRYRDLGKLPSETRQIRTWRTRVDDFAGVWPEIEAMLRHAPELEAKTLFEFFQAKQPDRFASGQLRTLQRRVTRWRAQSGPERTVFFPQVHRPGEAAQTDFTSANELEITVAGERFPHLLCHTVLPYSNWEHATVCRSESLPALRRGVQSFVSELGHVPPFHQTDNSTAATHRLGAAELAAEAEAKAKNDATASVDADGAPDGEKYRRRFNVEYSELMEHYGMTPRTTEVGAKEQNGDVEALNNQLKRRLKQHLLLRGSRDFPTVADYEAWVQSITKSANALRATRFKEELAVMRRCTVARLPEYSEVRTSVTQWSTVRVKENSYSVPSRLIHSEVVVHVFDDRIEVYFAGGLELTTERLLGRKGHRIDYRHVIWSLVKKPGAFARYRFREDLFPSLTFRRAYDALCRVMASRQADTEYVRLLHLAASTVESDVAIAIDLLLEEGQIPRSHIVGNLVNREPDRPEMTKPTVDLGEYDELLGNLENVA